MSKLVLSIFPGIDLLGRAFEEVFRDEICLVRGPDVLWGGDVRGFHPPAGKFWGVIGGPPCQDFSPMASINRSLGRKPKYGNLIPEFERCVVEAQPEWFLMENVERAPLPVVPGYQVKDSFLSPRWLGEKQSRLRRFSFGTRQGLALLIDGLVILENIEYEPAVISTRGWLGKSGAQCKGAALIERDKAARRRSMAQLLELQGLPTDLLDDAPFSEQGKRRVVANAVPRSMGRAMAQAVKQVMRGEGEEL